MSGPSLRPFVFKLGRIGDMVMLTAALRLLHRRYGERCYVVGADSWVKDLYRAHPDVAQCWSLPRKAPFPLSSGWPAVLHALRASAPGPVYVFEHHAGQVRRIRRLLALARVDRRRCLFLDERPGTEKLWIDVLVRFAERTPRGLEDGGYPLPAKRTAWTPELFVLDSDRAERDAWLRARGWRGEPLILIQPGNHRSMGRRRIRRWRNRDDKAWPPERWAQLLRRLHAAMPEALILLRGAAPEVPMLETIRGAAGLPAVQVAGAGMRCLLALCECAHSMISVDTGPAHAAAALGLPLVVLYGAQPPKVWLPRSAAGAPVIGLGGLPRAGRVDLISVDEVLEAWRAATQAARYAAAEPELAAPSAPFSSQMTSVTIEPSALSSSGR